MPESAGAKAAALDATVAVENAARRVNRLRADVAQTQRVLEELVEGKARAEAKAAAVAAIYVAKARETQKMIVAAERAVKAAVAALKAEES